MCGSMGAVSGKLAFDSDLDQYAKFSCVAVFIVSNVVMWATYTRSLALSDCTTTPMIINMACNFALTGVLGSLFFSESHSYTWWFFLVMLIAGLTLMFSPEKEESKED
uniref:EamA domain-containing protein n=1 Tax=Caenorhabditis tropicalis TaxID=1561998 RepID=A0A1I7U9V1_9PELO